MTASASLGHLHPPGSQLNPNSAPAPPGGCQERRYSIESETTPMVVGVGLFVTIFRSREFADLQSSMAWLASALSASMRSVRYYDTG